MNNFNGKIYNLKLLIKDMGFLIINIPQYLKAFRNKSIPKSFSEKIMLVITAVNGCRYCSWFHAKQALSSGMNETEIKGILDLQFHTNAAENEIPALLYAQNYAETDRNPDKEISDRLLKFYGEKTSGDINLYIRAIFVGNLCGNTFDAFLSRFRGIKAETSNVFFEFFFFLITLPVLLPLSFIIKKKN